MPSTVHTVTGSPWHHEGQPRPSAPLAPFSASPAVGHVPLFLHGQGHQLLLQHNPVFQLELLRDKGRWFLFALWVPVVQVGASSPILLFMFTFSPQPQPLLAHSNFRVNRRYRDSSPAWSPPIASPVAHGLIPSLIASFPITPSAPLSQP